MATYLVGRHDGARDWFERRDVNRDELIPHLDVEIVEPGDVVVGTLPVNLAAEVCSRGGRYVHLSMRVPAEFRQRELTPEQMDEFGATLEEFTVRRVERTSRKGE